MKHVVKHLHFVGIGGAGMSGIAEVLLTLGYKISGSDIAKSATTDRLQTLGAHITFAHAAQNIAQADVIVISSAIHQDNPEIQAALKQHIPVISRAIMLAELMRLKQGIAIAGSHGKTTTTSLLVSVLAQAGLDPTFVIGGKLNSAGAHARLGAGDFIVAEADESDASFLNLFPVMEVITNIDADHLHTYGHDFSRLKHAFVEFTQRLPFYGRVALCIDDPQIQDILPHITKPMILYGLSEEAQVRAIDLKTIGTTMHFTVLRDHRDPLPIRLNLLGIHNVQNALATIAIAGELEVPDEAIQYALSHFKGVSRRFQSYGELPLPKGGTYTLIDDYGHHPVEIAATLKAARMAWPDKRLVLAFEPHRFTRTRDCFEDFVNVLSTADALFLTEVYAASEQPIAGADGEALIQGLKALPTRSKTAPVFVKTVDALPKLLLECLEDQDLVITMGAGSIEKLPKYLKEFGASSSQPMATPSPLSFGKVAVLLGGDSAEREVSLHSGKLVLNSLQKQGIDAHAFDPASRPLESLRSEGFDRVFNILHGGKGEDGRLQGALDYFGMPYTGSKVLGSALSMDKLRSKQIWAQAGISTPEFDIVLRGKNESAQAQRLIEKLGLPLFVKPACEGSSIAIAKVHHAQALMQAINEAHKYDPIALIERSIEGGSEYSIVLVEGLDLPIIRIVPAGEFYDYHAKYVANDTQYFIPSGLSKDDERTAKAEAQKAFKLLACSGWGRIDAMTDAQGKLYFLEANTAPGMTDHSLVPKAASAVGVNYDTLVSHILEQTLVLSF